MSTDELDGLVHVTAAIVGLGLLALLTRVQAPRYRTAILVCVLGVGLAAFPGYDRLRGENFLHPPELYHYVFGAKYFPELGYEDLYDATCSASLEQRVATPLKVRNLRTGIIEPATSAYPRGDVALAKFRGMRLYEFGLDLRQFVAACGASHVAGMIDHGFNGTPTWIAEARAVIRDQPITRAHLVAYASIDVVLLAMLALALLWAFGLEATAYAALLVGTAWTWRFAWTGGSLLRYDWVVALGLALVALKKERPGVAGALLAWSTALRIFPAAFALAAGLSFLFRARDRAGRIALARYVLGFALAGALAFGAGATTGRGVRAWSEFASRIATHSGAWASNHIGLDNIAVVDRAITGRLSTDPDALDPFQDYVAPIERARHDRRPVLLVFVVACIAAVAMAARRLQPWQTMPLGAIIAFSLSAISGYYWVMLVVVPFAAPRRTTLFLVGTTFLAAGIELLFHNMTAAHIVLSFAYCAIFIDWLDLAIRGVAAPELAHAPAMRAVHAAQAVPAVPMEKS